MIVVSTIYIDISYIKVIFQLLYTFKAAFALSYYKFMCDLITSFVAFSYPCLLISIRLFYKINWKTSFTIYKTNYPTNFN